MSDTDRLRVRKDYAWVILSFAFALMTLGAGYVLARPLIHEGQPVKESLQILATVLAVPAFLLISLYNRISSETIGVILGALIGFALGRIG